MSAAAEMIAGRLGVTYASHRPDRFAFSKRLQLAKTQLIDKRRLESALAEHIDSDRPVRNSSASLRRALNILFRLAENDVPQEGIRLSQLAIDLDMSKATVLRLLGPLCEAHLVRRHDVGGGYSLGFRTAQIGSTYLTNLDIRDIARDILGELCKVTSETAHLAVLELPAVVFIDKVESPRAVRMHSRIGMRQSAYSTSVGKALLAHSDNSAVECVISAGMMRHTANTVTDPESFMAELEATRVRGYAIDNIENEDGVRCVAAPVFDSFGKVCAAISVSGPSVRLTAGQIADVARAVRAAAADLSLRMGGHV